MTAQFSQRYEKRLVTIHPGELYVSSEDEIIATLLGSCVAVCLHDNEKKISGMNHYMLEGKLSGSFNNFESTNKHAFHSLAMLIKEMLKHGCKKENITAKVFGGGKVLAGEMKFHTIPEDNVTAAKIILEMEDIVITESDTGGKFTRKVLLESRTGKVFLKKSLNSNVTKDESKQLS